MYNKEIENIPEYKICFSFNFFKEYSIRIHDFNNYYQNKLSSINSVNDFIDTIREMGKYSKNELFSKNIKKEFHLNEIHDNRSIDLIEKVLIDGYKMPQDFVDTFERTYIEFSTKSGKRVIAALMYGTLFECLFLDPNHLICPKSSRKRKEKMIYNIHSPFQRWDRDELELASPMVTEYIKMAIEDYENGKTDDTETVSIIKDLLRDNEQ